MSIGSVGLSRGTKTPEAKIDREGAESGFHTLGPVAKWAKNDLGFFTDILLSLSEAVDAYVRSGQKCVDKTFPHT